MQNNRVTTVSLFATCIVDQLFPQVGVSVVRVLRRLGVRVEFPMDQTCCGQPLYNSGFNTPARRLAKRVLKAFDGAEYVVAPSGSCAAMMRVFYLDLFQDDPELHQAAQRFSAKVYEFLSVSRPSLGRRRYRRRTENLGNLPSQLPFVAGDGGEGRTPQAVGAGVGAGPSGPSRSRDLLWIRRLVLGKVPSHFRRNAGRQGRQRGCQRGRNTGCLRHGLFNAHRWRPAPPNIPTSSPGTWPKSWTAGWIHPAINSRNCR